MDENDGQNLDTEFKRYLEIMRPYLGQLLDQDVIEMCNAWIQRLSKCREHERIQRNKYIFALCYQLARGVLEEPFLRNPTDDLAPLTDDGNSDNSLSELEYQIIDLENGDAQMIYNNERRLHSTTEILSGDSDFKDNTNKRKLSLKSNESNTSMTYKMPEITHEQNIVCYNCTTDVSDIKNYKTQEDIYCVRAHNFVTKLREIKRQNVTLQNELDSLKEELRIRNELDRSRDSVSKVNNATSTCALSQDSATTLKCKLEELKESRDALLNKITNLQDNLDNFDYIKKHERDNLEAKHKLEIIEIKTSIREEIKGLYENKLEDLKNKYEKSIEDIKTNYSKETEETFANKDKVISEKDKIIQSKVDEITKLNNYIEELIKQQTLEINKFSNITNIESNSESIKKNADELEKRLNKMEKSKLKCSKAFEIKLANLQKEKHLSECSFHLELLRQRAQVIHEMTNEHQTELTSALTKLESKYREIIANVQSTAVQRRIQDQMALESIIQAVCGARNEGMYTNSAQATCPSQLTNKAKRNQTRDCNVTCDIEMPTVFDGNKVGSVIVGNKSLGEESMANDYCLDSKKLGDLFERMYIPQRDTSGDSTKK